MLESARWPSGKIVVFTEMSDDVKNGPLGDGAAPPLFFVTDQYVGVPPPSSLFRLIRVKLVAVDHDHTTETTPCPCIKYALAEPPAGYGGSGHLVAGHDDIPRRSGVHLPVSRTLGGRGACGPRFVADADWLGFLLASSAAMVAHGN